MANDANGRARPHETLDGQLVRYWEREAARFDALAQHALLGWIARGYARRATRARAQAERSRVRETARGRTHLQDQPAEEDRAANDE